jgi:hypothetical protein
MRPFVAERAVAGPSEYKWSKVGFPIRKSSDQSSFAAPQGLSQRTTSFIASQRQGIHRTPLRHLITLMIDVRRSDERQPSTERPLLVAAFRPPEHMLANQARDRDGAVAPPLVSRGCGSPLLEPGSSSRFQTSARQPEDGARISMTPDRRKLWWSQTGSNRRPHACKARALPTELWPLTEDISHGKRCRQPWWAWDDSNVRPHPYQGCALTT